MGRGGYNQTSSSPMPPPSRFLLQKVPTGTSKRGKVWEERSLQEKNGRRDILQDPTNLFPIKMKKQFKITPVSACIPYTHQYILYILYSKSTRWIFFFNMECFKNLRVILVKGRVNVLCNPLIWVCMLPKWPSDSKSFSSFPPLFSLWTYCVFWPIWSYVRTTKQRNWSHPMKKGHRLLY